VYLVVSGEVMVHKMVSGHKPSLSDPTMQPVLRNWLNGFDLLGLFASG